jgi:hypothetical protein
MIDAIFYANRVCLSMQPRLVMLARPADILALGELRFTGGAKPIPSMARLG